MSLPATHACNFSDSMLYLLLEEYENLTKRQTLSNQGAQSRASLIKDRQIAEIKKFHGSQALPGIFFRNLQ